MTRSPWRGEQPRTTTDDTTRARPAGGAEQSRQKLITQKQAAQQIGLSERQVRRLLAKLRSQGDRAVIHAARGRASNRKISAKVEKRAAAILSKPLYADFGPTLAAEYLQQRHGIHVGRETLRGWMAAAGLWKPRRRKPGRAHLWRPRRRCRGELVQWDTSEHDWLEGRGEKLYLIGMIDDASSELLARFVRHDSSAENRRLLKTYLEKNGRPAALLHRPRQPVCQHAQKQRGRGPQDLASPLKSGGRSRSWASNRSGPIRRKPKDASSAALARPRTGW